MKKRYHLLNSIVACIVCALGVVYPAIAADKTPFVKAAFIFNFTKFVSWPSPYNIADINELTVCLIGKDGLGRATAVLKEGSTSSLAIKTKYVSSTPSKQGECHILFISKSQSSSVPSIINASKGSLALTVSDADGFVDKGGMIGFVMEENKIRLHINKGATDAEGLKLDTQLLEIARSVKR